jgi:hypothetical protein
MLVGPNGKSIGPFGKIGEFVQDELDISGV